MGILAEDVQRVRETTDLVALAGEHIALKRVGRSVTGLCPFHTEKSPSFSISPEKGVFYCFGCQKSGDAITFIRELEHLDFVEAVERLAARAGITLRYDDVSFSEERQRKQRLQEAVGEAIEFFHGLLLDSEPAGNARRYLRSRGFDGDVARKFSLGWSPDGYDALSRHLQQKKFSRDDIVDAGLAFVNKANKLQDSFRGRVMFPIWDGAGRPGRIRRPRARRAGPEVQEHARRRRSTRSRGCSTGCTGRRARSSRAARSSSARATPT